MNHVRHHGVLLKGSYGLGNFGDDVLLTIVYEHLRRHYEAAEIGILCSPASYLQGLLQSPYVVPREQWGQVSGDVLVYGGGTQFYAFPLTTATAKRKWRHRFSRITSDPFGLASAVRQRLLNGPLDVRKQHIHKAAALGIGFGPFCCGTEERRASRQMQSLDFIAVRDPVSLEYCQRWGLDHAKCFADMCFSMKPDVEVTESDPLPPSRPWRIGLIVRDWPHSTAGAAYYDRVVALEGHYRRAGVATSFILFGRDEYWNHSLATIGADVRAWDPNRGSIAAFLSVLNKFDLFVTARFHGAVFAALLNKPVVIIEVEPKLSVIATQLAASLWQYPFAVADAVAKIEEILGGHAMAKRSLQSRVKELRSQANAMMDSFHEYLAQP